MSGDAPDRPLREIPRKNERVIADIGKMIELLQKAADGGHLLAAGIVIVEADGVTTRWDSSEGTTFELLGGTYRLAHKIQSWIEENN